MTQRDFIRIVAQIAVLRDIQQEYSGKTIDNVIQQLESRRKEMRKKMEGGDT